MTLLGADAAAVPSTTAFVGVLLAFVPALTAAFCLEQIVRAEGAARQVMIGLIASTIANVVFDVLFILVLHWGVAGAALAMGLSNVGVVAYFAVWLHRHSEHVSLAPRWFTLSPAVLKPVFGVGSGELLQAGFLIVTSLVLNNLAVAYGDDALAAMGVAVRIAQVPEFLVMGVTLGVLPLLAYAYGKGDRDRLAAALRTSALTVGGMVAFFSITVFVFREQVFAAFVADRSVLAIGGRDPHRSAGGDDRERVRGPDHVAVPGDRGVGAGHRDVDGAGRAVRPHRHPRQPVVRSGRHHLGAHRHRGHRADRRDRAVAGVPSRHRPGPGRGLPGRAEAALEPAGA